MNACTRSPISRMQWMAYIAMGCVVIAYVVMGRSLECAYLRRISQNRTVLWDYENAVSVPEGAPGTLSVGGKRVERLCKGHVCSRL